MQKVVLFPPKAVRLTVALFAAASAQVLSAGPINGIIQCNDPNPCGILDQSTTRPAQSSTSIPGFGFVDAFADAGGGVLRARAAYEVLVPSPFTSQVNAVARWVDEITIDAPGIADGTPAFLGLRFTTSGLIAGNASAQMSAYVLGPSLPPPQVIPLDDGGGLVSFDLLPVTLGPSGTFTLVTELIASLYAGVGQISSGSADFSHTALLTGIGVFLDPAGTMPVSNPSFSASSGLTYTTNGIVPEPESLLLIGAGIAAIAVGRRHGTVKPIR